MTAEAPSRSTPTADTSCRRANMTSRVTGRAELTRRRVLCSCAAGTASLAGCLSENDDDSRADELTGTLHVNVSSAVDQPVRIQVVLVEENDDPDESVLGTYHIQQGDSVEQTFSELQGGPFRVVVRVDEATRGDDFETMWTLEECAELTLQPTVRDGELAVSWACSHATGLRF